MIHELSQPEKVKVSLPDWESFKRQMIFEILADRRLGQAFCDRFGIGNSSPLYYFKDDTVSERWITDNYLEWKMSEEKIIFKTFSEKSPEERRQILDKMQNDISAMKEIMDKIDPGRFEQIIKQIDEQDKKSWNDEWRKSSLITLCR